MFAVFNVTNVVYIIWASGEVQPWNDGNVAKQSIESAKPLDDKPYVQEIEEKKRENLN